MFCQLFNLFRLFHKSQGSNKSLWMLEGPCLRLPAPNARCLRTLLLQLNDMFPVVDAHAGERPQEVLAKQAIDTVRIFLREIHFDLVDLVSVIRARVTQLTSLTPQVLSFL